MTLRDNYQIDKFLKSANIGDIVSIAGLSGIKHYQVIIDRWEQGKPVKKLMSAELPRPKNRQQRRKGI